MGTARRKLKRVILMGLGFLFLATGVIGIALPLIPTTGPLLLAAALFAKTSPRFHHWLINHRIFGTYIRNYRDHRGMNRRHKWITLATLWLGIAASGYVARNSLVALISLAVVLVGVTIHVATLKTVAAETGSQPDM